MKKEDIEKMNSMKWYHKIQLKDNIITPGNSFDDLWTSIKKEMKKVDFLNKKILDIGCWDGLFSFEAEKLGASEVLATDINNQRSFTEQGCSTFEFAKKHLASKVKYKEASVYEIDDHFRNQFDIVMFFGVLYHLRYPQLGIAKIRNSIKLDGILLMETAVLLDTDDTIIQTDYKKIYPTDRSTWNAFSIPAICSLLDESYFKVEEYKIIRVDNGGKIGRAFFRSKAYSGVNNHHYFPDIFLKDYFHKIGK